jgi:hypothetical protein
MVLMPRDALFAANNDAKLAWLKVVEPDYQMRA